MSEFRDYDATKCTPPYEWDPHEHAAVGQEAAAELEQEFYAVLRRLRGAEARALAAESGLAHAVAERKALSEMLAEADQDRQQLRALLRATEVDRDEWRQAASRVQTGAREMLDRLEKKHGGREE